MQRAGQRAQVDAKRKAKATEPDGCPPAPRNLEDAAEFASWLTHAVTVGKLDARTAHEAAYSLRAFQAMVEKRDLQREIEGLRADLKEAQKPRPRAV